MSWGAFLGALGAGAMNRNRGGQTTTNAPWSGFQGDILGNMEWLQDSIGTRGYFPGSTVAPTNRDITTGQEMVRDAAGNIQQMNDPMMATMMGYMDPSFLDIGNNPVYQQTVNAATAPITQAFTESVLPGIRSGARMTGGSDYGSTRQGVAEGIATGKYMDAVGNVAGRLAGDMYSQNLSAQQRGMSMIPMMSNMMLAPGQAIRGVGQDIFNLNQTNLDADVNRYNYNRDQEWNERVGLNELMMGSNYGTRTVNDGSGGNFMNMMGGAMMGNAIQNNWGGNTTSDLWSKDAWDSDFDDLFSDDYGW